VGITVAAEVGEAAGAGVSGGAVDEGGMAGAAEEQAATNRATAARPSEDPGVKLRRMADLLKEGRF
jgi:hypothetical protein